MRLRELETLAAIFETGSASEAARLLGVTQPAISRTLARLEDKLGFELFNRVNGRLVTTRRAEAIRAEVQNLLDGLHNLTRITDQLSKGRVGELRFGCAQSMIYSRLPRAVKLFSNRWPETRLSIEPRPTQALVDLVAARKLDLALLFLPVQHPGIEVESLDWFASQCVLPAGHPLTGKSEVGPGDLADERLIMLSRLDPARFAIEHAFRLAQVAPRIALETPNVALAVNLVEQGCGITIVNGLMLGDLKIPRDRAVRFAPEIRHQLALIRPANCADSAECAALAALLREMFAA